MTHQYCTFLLDGHLFGVSVASVQEVLKEQAVTPVPLAPREVSGLINLRGQIVTTLDLRTRLGIAPRPAGAPSVSVVVRAADGGPVSLVVDQIGDVLEAPEGALEAPPDTVPAELRELVAGIYKLEDRLMLLLDTERAVTVSEVAA
ncbi:MAG TPA: chemotaxis protein CheW [Marmoricola sp.]|nr:chemotaxis protein CheW [Marmoricola sp.]